jgi:outer membrane immunogenic protein
MKRQLGWALGAAVLFANASTAFAADMAVKARPIVAAPVYNWTGCYIGASGGGKFVRARDTANNPATAFPTPASSVDFGTAEPDTWLAGGQVGCNYQTGAWVFGIEGDAHAQRWATSNTLVGAVQPFNFVPGDSFELRSDWQASIRGRVGYAIDRTLLYVTGGVAFTQVRANSAYVASFIGATPVPAQFAGDTKTLTGGTVGAGIEHAVTDNLTLGLEGRYTWYGNQRFDAGAVPAAVNPGPVFVTSPNYRDVRVETGEVLVKANWKFGPSAVVARY